ncbi:hypothetical protein D3C81_523480 [compost metagenome]
MQQGEFFGCQVDTLAVAVGAVTTGVQLQVGDFQGVRLQGLIVAAQQAADPCQQFGEFEGLEQIVVSTQVQAPDPV